MKVSLKSLLVVSVVVSIMSLVLNVPIFGGITNSDHDFSSYGWSNGQICITCHTPHNANTVVPDAPLWNHTETTQIFTPYNSATLDASIGQPDGSSKLCLSCHDGSIAIDSFGGDNGTNYVGSGKQISSDLNEEHPISFTYDDSLAGADGALNMPSVSVSGLGGTIQADLLRNGKVQCVSCHDIHNQFGNSKLLIKDNTGSALCLTCHNL